MDDMKQILDNFGAMMESVGPVREAVEGGFDTKMRQGIEHSATQLHSLSKKDDPKARQHEQEVINGLMRMLKSNPEKFLYSVLEILGVRGKYKSSRYGMK